MFRMTIAGVLSRHTPTTKFAGNMTCVSASSCPHLYGILQCTWSYHRIIESSGGPEILSSAEVLAQNSVRGFIHGQHFNYCTQIHPLFALALQILHFRHFIEMHGHGVQYISDECIVLSKSFLMSPINQIPCLEFWNRLQQMFCFSVMSSSVIRPVGKTYGSIARFWLLYVALVHNLHALWQGLQDKRRFTLHTCSWIDVLCVLRNPWAKLRTFNVPVPPQLTERGSNASWDPDELWSRSAFCEIVKALLFQKRCGHNLRTDGKQRCCLQAEWYSLFHTECRSSEEVDHSEGQLLARGNVL